MPKMFDYVEPIDVDNIYNSLQEEVPGIKMFKNKIKKDYKNIFNTPLQIGRRANRNIFAKKIIKDRTMCLLTQPPTIDRKGKIPDLIWRKMKLSSPQPPDVVLSSWKEDDNDYDYSDDDKDEDNYNKTNEIIIDFEKQVFKIPSTAITTTEKVTTVTIQATAAYQNQSSNITLDQNTKHQLPDNFVILNGTRKGQCYRCGTNTGHSENSFCHDLFNNNEYRSLVGLLRTTCYDNPSVSHGKKVKWPKEYDKFKLYQYTDQGLETKLYGSYSGGCFKRFLDIGNFYTQRGCRQWPPDGNRFRRRYFDHPTTQLYRRLEKKLGKSERDACVYSLHASLVPFSRDQSLFARHHVCVCKGRYCNAASNIITSFVSFILGVIYFIK
ncbi:uncharacterized protein LOC113227489 [Hyposmocoma kahamanoa]|uniref:uncharacterized protein LOC113227489 n=1 Tax=Hyposmocoma kahamanoa TaxID=1477025 RepID=UPI000E6D874F|nr:uncharacterized protein LOC113227489 [Hyposmocoma kahamanoa]